MKNNSIKYPTCVVLGLGINGLGIVRSLGKRCVDCYGVYSRDEEVGRKSRYCTAVKIPSLNSSEEAFHKELMELLREIGGMPVIFPTDDLSVAYLIKYREFIEPLARFSFGSSSSAELLLDKWRFSKALNTAGVSAPETQLVSSNISEVSAEIFPCVCKPRKSFLANDVCIDKVLLFNTKAEFENYFIRSSRNIEFDGSKLVLQELVVGSDRNVVFCALHMGVEDATVVFTGRKIHQYPPGFGISSVCVFEQIPEIIKKTILFLKFIGYVGPAEAEFKWDDDKKLYQMIEINPRSWTNNSIATAAGCDVIWNTYLFVVDSKKEIRDVAVKGKRVVWIDEIGYLGSIFRKFKANPFSVFSLVDVWPILSNKRVYGCFQFNDLSPFFLRIKNFLKNYGR